MATVPFYVIDYAPKVWLHSKDRYRPADIGAQLQHTRPQNGSVAIDNVPANLNLDNLDSLNGLSTAGGQGVYLTSVDDVTTNPAWLNGVTPDGSGKTKDAISAVIIVTDHGSGRVDAFYMYFYAFNQGNKVFGFEIGDHIGDWEHNMIRFENGQPKAIWYSQHANGEAFTYDAVEKDGRRTIVYSALGTHANYATAGPHDHTIPNFNFFFGPVTDRCDKGILWDPTLSAYKYLYDLNTKDFTPAASPSGGDDPNLHQPVGYLRFLGRWGDRQYTDSDRRQRKILGIAVTRKYADGPTGPIDKQLDRNNVCPDNGNPCIVRPLLGP